MTSRYITAYGGSWGSATQRDSVASANAARSSCHVFTTGGRKIAVACRSAGAMPCRRSWTCRPSIRAGWTACPDSLQATLLAERLEAICEHDFSDLESLEPSLGYGRD